MKGPGKAALAVLPTLALVLVVQSFFVTYGTGEFFGPESRSDAFDSLGRNLLEGRADVDPETVNWEGLDINGKKYMYWGPLPALVRIVPNLLRPDQYGRWARLSSLLASLLALVAMALIVRYSLRDNNGLGGGDKAFLTVCSLAGLGLGTPLLYLISSARIYHESIIWGLCASLWGVLGVLGLTNRWFSDRLGFSLLSTGAGLALLARVTFAVPLYAVLALMTTAFVVSAVRRDPTKAALHRIARSLWQAGDLVLPALAATIFQLWYNWKRFGAVTIFLDTKRYYIDVAKLGGSFNPARIPSSLLNYFGWNRHAFPGAPPWVEMTPVTYLQDSLFFGWKEQTVSLLVASPWLLFAAACGAFALYRGRGRSIQKASGALLLLQWALICSWFFVSQRFAAEFLPAMVFFLSFYLARHQPFSWPGRAFLTTTIAYSIAATILSTLSWHMLYATPGIDIPREWNRRLQDTFYGLSPRASLYTLRHQFAHYTLVDSLDIEEGASQTDHGFEELFERSQQPTHNFHRKTLLYQPRANGIFLHDDGRRISDEAHWQVKNVAARADLVMIVRYDHSGGATYDLAVNGHPIEEPLRLPGGEEAWDEASVRIPAAFLVEGTNEFRLARNQGSERDSELYYMWFLQALAAPPGAPAEPNAPAEAAAPHG